MGRDEDPASPEFSGRIEPDRRSRLRQAKKYLAAIPAQNHGLCFTDSIAIRATVSAIIFRPYSGNRFGGAGYG
jgi:hypothetical protein